MFSPGCRCCGGDGPPPDPTGGCCRCLVVPFQWTLTVSGVVPGFGNDICPEECDGMNGAFTLTYNPDSAAGGAPECVWESEEMEVCLEVPLFPRYTLKCNYFGPEIGGIPTEEGLSDPNNWVWQLITYRGGAGGCTNVVWETGTEALEPINCFPAGPIPLAEVGFGSFGCLCALTDATITIAPLI